MNTQHQHICSCGEPSDHIIMRRRSADNVSVVAWSSGEVGSRMQLQHRGRLAPEVVSAIMGEVEIFDFRELPALIRAARELHRRGRLNPGALRSRAIKILSRERSSRA